MFLPWSNTSCQLPLLPVLRAYHVQSGALVCGGEFVSSAQRSCVNWSVQGDWTTLPLTLTEERAYSSGWAHGDQLVIMGGYSDAARESSEIVSSDGAVTSRSFRMKYKTR